MSDQLPSAVRDLWQQTPTGAAPIEAIVQSGRRARARRRVLIAGLAAAAVAVVAGGAVMFTQEGQKVSGPPPVASKPSAAPSLSLPLPANMRLVGYAGVTVAVPRNWMVNTAPCGQPDRAFIGFASLAPLSCPRFGAAPTVSALGVGPPDAMDLPSTGWTWATSDGGVRYERTAVRCGGGRCEQSYRPQGGDVAFHLVVTAGDRNLLRTVPASLAPLPAGKVAVPHFDPGTDLGRVAALLHAAGLQAINGEAKTKPPTPVSSSPEPGTVVPAGSTVTVVMD